MSEQHDYKPVPEFAARVEAKFAGPDPELSPENNGFSIAEPTYGQKAVGINFDPDRNPEVFAAKSFFATIIDQMNNLRATTASSEVKRLCSIAITEAQGAMMWSVKAITWKD